MRKLMLAGTIVVLSSLSSIAQVLKYEAKVDQNGQIQLVPLTEGATTSPATHTSIPDQVFVWSNATGDIKGVFTSQADALTKPLAQGDTIKAVSFEGASAPNYDQMKQVAEAAAKQLMQSARDTACAFDYPPESITPTVEVSFSLLAGGSFSISATWLTKDVCKVK